jgi:glycosyltransferase involved in cell wall biosynthesis
LIIVDDGSESAAALIPVDERIRYCRLDTPVPLGSKLNLGIAQASGQIIQKLDDDDYYRSDFLDATVHALLGHGSERAVVGLDCFLVLIAVTGELKFSGHGWCAGGTLCFFKRLWELRRFREVPSAVDWGFLADHTPERIVLCEPELYILVRHRQGHLWTDLKGLDVTDYFAGCPAYPKTLADCVAAEDERFYRHLASTYSPSPATDGGRDGDGDSFR